MSINPILILLSNTNGAESKKFNKETQNFAIILCNQNTITPSIWFIVK
jgi:hypothetical protein